MSVLTDDEDEEYGGHHEADALGRAPGRPVYHIGFLGMVVLLPHAIAAHLLVHVGRQLHLHLAVLTLHVLRQVEARV